ncbi:MAG TPA: NRDE family protein [Lysobacter sp.]
MCLIAVAWNAHPRYRLALIANRDEAHDRPASPAGVDPADPTVYGGRDLRAGGSWLMASRHGRLAAVTNVRAGLAEGTLPRSRGALVHGFVVGNDSNDAFLAGVGGNAAEYGRFNLLTWDGDGLGFASNYPAFERRAVAPGLHAMSNGAFDAPWPKSGHAVAALDAWLRSPASADASADDAALATLFEALADTHPAPDAALPDTGVGLELERRLSPPFVRGPNYGTRCSTVVLVDDAGITFVEQSFGPDGVRLGRTRARLAIE